MTCHFIKFDNSVYWGMPKPWFTAGNSHNYFIKGPYVTVVWAGSKKKYIYMYIIISTVPETNIAPENETLNSVEPLISGMASFQGLFFLVHCQFSISNKFQASCLLCGIISSK